MRREIIYYPRVEFLSSIIPTSKCATCFVFMISLLLAFCSVRNKVCSFSLRVFRSFGHFFIEHTVGSLASLCNGLTGQERKLAEMNIKTGKRVIAVCRITNHFNKFAMRWGSNLKYFVMAIRQNMALGIGDVWGSLMLLTWDFCNWFDGWTSKLNLSKILISHNIHCLSFSLLLLFRCP